MENIENIKIPDFDVFELREHQPFKQPDNYRIGNEKDYAAYIPYLKSLSDKGVVFSENTYEGIPKYLGINNFRSSYYIGASWLVGETEKITRDSKAVVVTPKIPDIDFSFMLLKVLNFSSSSNYFSKFYGIDLDKPFIQSNSLNNQLTPLLIVQYLLLIEKLIKKGLKKGYKTREENLKSKIKGKILVQKNLQRNIFQKREDRNYCFFQEYSTDIPENRLLKKALVFAIRAISILNQSDSLNIIKSRLKYAATYFEDVSENIEPHEIKNLRFNKLFSEYTDSIRIAKMILKRFDYSLKEAGEEQNYIPPFWIDMSRLYEVYVYSLLEEAYPGMIKFQVKGHSKSAVDFIKTDEEIIMDTKYKPKYDYSYSGILEDIREISGYSRDRWITKYFKNIKENEEIPCVIIYPEIPRINKEDFDIQDKTNEEDNDITTQITDIDNTLIVDEKGFDKNQKILEQINTEVLGFRNFYMLSVTIPIYHWA